MGDLTSIFRAMPLLFLVSLAVLCESVAVFLAGFASIYWWIGNGLAFGLWRVCRTSLTTCVDLVDPLPTYMWVARVCCIASLLTQLAGITQLLMFAYKGAYRNYALGAFASCLSASGLSIVGASAYFANHDTESGSAGWSVVLVLLSAIMQAHSAACIIVPVKRGQVVFVNPPTTTTLQPVGAQGQVMGYPGNQYYAAPSQGGVPMQYQGAAPGTAPAPYVVQGAPQYQGAPQGYFQGAPQGNFQGAPQGHFQGDPRGQHQGAHVPHQEAPPQSKQPKAGGNDTGSHSHLVAAEDD